MKKYPLAEPNSMLYKALKQKTVKLTMAEEKLGIDWKGDIYKIVNNIAKKL